jgi:hypothetical protein
MDEVVGTQGVAVELVSRVQLRAVLSGLLVGAGVYAICMGLSWAIGLSTFQPTADHARGLALGTIIWGAIALWISIFFGGFVAAVAGRSADSRTGVLHGVVVWGATAVFHGLLLLLVFSGLLGRILEMSATSGAVVISTRALDGLIRAAGLSLWLYWAGIVGGLVTAIVGGFLGAGSERKAPRRAAARAPVTGVPQPTY